MRILYHVFVVPNEKKLHEPTRSKLDSTPEKPKSENFVDTWDTRILGRRIGNALVGRDLDKYAIACMLKDHMFLWPNEYWEQFADECPKDPEKLADFIWDLGKEELERRREYQAKAQALDKFDGNC